MSLEQDAAALYFVSLRSGSLGPAFRPHRLLVPAATVASGGESALTTVTTEVEAREQRGD